MEDRDTAIKTEILIHDLKVPLSVIDAGAKSLLNRREAYGPLTDKQVKVIRRIIRNTLTTQRLVNDMLELGRSREGVVNLSRFTVGELITAVLVELFDLCNPPLVEAVREAGTCDGLCRVLKESGFGLDFEAKVWATQVCLDRAKVKQIVRNLLSNAYKHRASWVNIRGSVDETHLVVHVRDDGKGIPPSDHRRIFDTYFTTGACIDEAIDSHGLGLAGVMVLLKDMGGSLALDSESGKGAEFTVVIPLKQGG